MLFTVEGGGFFSSSSSGFCDGLGLLFLRRSKERPMRVSPWNRYQLVGPGVDRVVHGQLDSKKSQLFRKWALFICFGCASAALKGPGQCPSEVKDENFQAKQRLKSSLKQVDFLALSEVGKVNGDCVDRRRVHWRDASGGALAEVKEFDAGEEEPSDEEHGSDGIRGCDCVIQ